MATHIDLETPVSSNDPEPVRAAHAFLHGDADELAGPLTDDVAEALIAALLRYEAVSRLEKLASGKDKALAKRARGGLHRLRARGLQADVPRPSMESIMARASAPEPAPISLASSVIRDGERLLWLTRNDARGKVEVFQAQVHEVRGMTQFQALRTSRKRWRLILNQFLAELHMPVAPMDSAYVRWLIDEGARITMESGRSPPRDYLEIQHLLGDAVAPPRHPAYDVVPEEQIVEARKRGNYERLLDLPETEAWIPEEEMARKVARQLSELVVVDDAQRRKQAQEIVAQAARDALGTKWRARLARRLLDTALLIAARAQVAKPGRDFAADAALALAAAEQMQDMTVSIDDLALARRLFERLLSAAGLAASRTPLASGDGPMMPPLSDALGGAEEDDE